MIVYLCIITVRASQCLAGTVVGPLPRSFPFATRVWNGCLSGQMSEATGRRAGFGHAPQGAYAADNSRQLTCSISAFKKRSPVES
jgi:hypothetical protein